MEGLPDLHFGSVFVRCKLDQPLLPDPSCSSCSRCTSQNFSYGVGLSSVGYGMSAIPQKYLIDLVKYEYFKRMFFCQMVEMLTLLPLYFMYDYCVHCLQGAGFDYFKI